MGVPAEFTAVSPSVVHHVPVVTVFGGSAAAEEAGGDVVADPLDATVVGAPGVVVVLVVLDACVVEVWGSVVVVRGFVFTDVSLELMLKAATTPPTTSTATIAPISSQRRRPRGAPRRLA